MHRRADGTTIARRLTGTPWSWVLLVVLVLGAVFARTCRRVTPRTVRVLWPMPAWALVDQDGQPFGTRELRGRVYIANFVFTSCVLECPRLTHEMSHIVPRVERYGAQVHLVSLSVDPAHDTPEQLRAYMARYHADPRRWTFVTGPEDRVLQAITQGFRVGVETPAHDAGGTINPADLAHSSRLTLVDARGRLRGTYPAEPEGIQELLDDLAVVVAER